MIFRIRLPRLEELFGLESDDRDWHDIARPKELYLANQRCKCWCIGTDMNTTFYAVDDQTGDHSDGF